ncbi:MerR family transcriptional regulator [Labedaea rhizosphaerae]|uniref:DNA-binding transcriptional MerR regulator n=1 Tax=Labedaea rhizosphaerae TaxID=598644 RepID=A0A4R6SCI5_LABRH|nr:MerR family transcriptional regulator [Labedaea rhizosphaerae]TDP97799.1 DNA-binding transcriptional MerR regulator [Labedaea rhizosphaerae]
MRISELAERSGVPASTLRFYEAQGLLPAERTPAGYRVYDERDVERVAFIAAAKRLGLSLAQAGELLTTWDDGVCTHVKSDLRPRLAERLVEADRHAAESTAFAVSLRAALARLDTLPDRAGPCTEDCLARDVPVACSLGETELGDRVTRWRDLVADATRVELPGGVRLTVPVDRAAAIAELAVQEQRCCPFFDFRLHLDGASLHVDVLAPAEAAELVTDLFPPSRSDGEVPISPMP